MWEDPGGQLSEDRISGLRLGLLRSVVGKDLEVHDQQVPHCEGAQRRDQGPKRVMMHDVAHGRRSELCEPRAPNPLASLGVHCSVSPATCLSADAGRSHVGTVSLARDSRRTRKASSWRPDLVKRPLPADDRVMVLWGVVIAVGVAVYLGSQSVVALAYRDRHLERRWPWSLDPEAPAWIGLANLVGVVSIVIGSAKFSATDEGQYLLVVGATVLCLVGRSAVRWIHNRRTSSKPVPAGRDS